MADDLPTIPDAPYEASSSETNHDGDGHDVGHSHHMPTTPLGKFVHTLQKYAIPLLSGIVVALIWANAHPESYERCVGAGHDAWPLTDMLFMGHPITIHFVINDIFMCLFFGIAAKEVTESCLPGGSLNPPKKALSPLFATLGGVLGPVATYFILVLVFWSAGAFDEYTISASGSSGGHRMLSEASSSGISGSGSGSLALPAPEAVVIGDILIGWGVPAATDISLAWMVAVQIFPFHHPAIDFLLLLAVADDAIGLVIIAVAYGDGGETPIPFFCGMLLILGGILIAFILRRVLGVQHWSPYVLLGGVCSWFGLIGAALHPALALCFVVPFMPSHPPASKPKQMPTLHAFEHDLKVFVDMGMFAFTLANAGIRLQYVGALTWIMLLSLIVGKILGITFLVLSTDRCKVAPLNAAIQKPADVLMVGSMASIGLTVALFVSGEAFKDERLQGEAKLGALLSGLMGAVCVLVAKLPCWQRKHQIFVRLDAEQSHAAKAQGKSSEKVKMDKKTKRPKRQGLDELNVAEQIYFKSAIRAGDTAFLVPRHEAEKASLLDMAWHDRAQVNWKLARQGSRRIVPIHLAVSAGGDRTSSGATSTGAVVGIMRTQSTKKSLVAAYAAAEEKKDETVVESIA